VTKESPSGAGANRRERILQAAEMVFAQEGYHAATMRAIAAAAEAKLSLVVYHFESKLGLYREVFLRRQYLNEERREMLRAVDFDAPDAAHQLAAAFADPVLRLHESPTDVWFARLVLREAADPSSHERGIIHELFDPMAQEFIQAIVKVNPGRDREFYPWAYLFAVGALTSSANDARAGDLGRSAKKTVRDAHGGPDSPKGRHLKEFIAAGWAATD